VSPRTPARTPCAHPGAVGNLPACAPESSSGPTTSAAEPSHGRGGRRAARLPSSREQGPRGRRDHAGVPRRATRSARRPRRPDRPELTASTGLGPPLGTAPAVAGRLSSRRCAAGARLGFRSPPRFPGGSTSAERPRPAAVPGMLRAEVASAFAWVATRRQLVVPPLDRRVGRPHSPSTDRPAARPRRYWVGAAPDPRRRRPGTPSSNPIFPRFATGARDLAHNRLPLVKTTRCDSDALATRHGIGPSAGSAVLRRLEDRTSSFAAQPPRRPSVPPPPRPSAPLPRRSGGRRLFPALPEEPST
jgi:hypothetical protein